MRQIPPFVGLGLLCVGSAITSYSLPNDTWMLGIVGLFIALTGTAIYFHKPGLL